jgi:hypothetical protein
VHGTYISEYETLGEDMAKKTAEHDNSATIIDASRTCFVIMPISDVDGYPTGHFDEVYKQLIEPAVTDAGYRCTLATSTAAAHMIQLEVVTKVATADLCICDLSTNNPNVLFEYGIRQAFDKPTVLIKDNKTRRLFDLSGFRDIEYDSSLRIANTLASRKSISDAIAETVDGNADESQIFSLVKLMKLAKAALPSGELSQDDARFALIERKLDNLIIGLNNINQNKQSSIRASILPKINHDDRYRVSFSSGSIIINDASTGSRDSISNQSDLERTEFWSTLTGQQQNEIQAMIDKHSPKFIPF